MSEISQMVLTFKIDFSPPSLASSERGSSLHDTRGCVQWKHPVEHNPWQSDVRWNPTLSGSVATASHDTETGFLSEGRGLSSLPSTAIWVAA